MIGPEIGNSPAQATLTMVQGDDWSRTFKLRRGTPTGDPIDLTGCTLSAAIYQTDGKREVELPVTPVDLAQGEVSVVISDTVSSSLSAKAFDSDPRGEHLFVIRLTDVVGNTRTLLHARMVVRSAA